MPTRVPAPSLALSLLALAALPAPAAAREARWRWPLEAPVVRTFSLAADRYARGQHRGITLAAQPGAAVRAACGGRVTFAGTVAANGRVVAVACGRLSATYTRLGAVAVRRGARLAPGALVGRVGAAGRLQLGARVRPRRDGYLDPLTLLGGPRRAPPLGPAPPAGRRRPPPPAPAPARARPSPAPARPPLAALWWPAGLGLLVLAPALAALRRARRLRAGGEPGPARRRAPEAA